MAESKDVRVLDAEAAKQLPTGADHYRAYVGPPQLYDFLGAAQFRLLIALGLRDRHTLLDFGCGSLRAGRFFIPYLQAGHYHGLEPNRWLIEDAIEREVGRAMVDLKRPVFRYEDDFSARHFGKRFDFILAQSIFSHAGRDIIATSLDSFRDSLAENGLILATFVHPEQLRGAEEYQGDGWLYPGCYAYRSETILEMIGSCGLIGRVLPWFHPRQTWYAAALTPEALPPASCDVHLSGAVLRDPDLQASLR